MEIFNLNINTIKLLQLSVPHMVLKQTYSRWKFF